MSHRSAININHIDSFPEVQLRWNTNQEVAQILCSAIERHPEWLTSQVRERPPSGSHLLFKRFDGNYFKLDGYEWKRRREGKLIREDHMKLKIQKQEILSANYVHSAVVPTFHRRVYWLTSNPDIVLVHYLNCSDGDQEGRNLADRIAQCIRTSGLNLTNQQLVAQITPILCSTIPLQEVTEICADVWHFMNSIERICLTNRTMRCHDSPSGILLERRNSCSSAFRSGLSSVALKRQPSTFSDSVNVDRFVDVVVNNYGEEDVGGTNAVIDDLGYCGQGTDSISYSGETHRSSSVDETQLRCPTTRSTSNGTSSNGEWSRYTNITEVTPGTAPLKGGIKLLVVGGWYMKGHDYSVLFGERVVPATLIQVGVLSTVVPPAKSPGPVRLRVLCNKQIVSSVWEFVYADAEKEERTNYLIQAMIDRIHLLMAAFNFQNDNRQLSINSTFDEAVFLRLLQSIRGNQLTFPHLLSPPLLSRSILHLAASLDYSRVIEYVMWWSKDLQYTRETDPLARDTNGKTPLHEAVSCGHLASARVLVNGCPATLDVLDDRGRTPCELSTDPNITRITTRGGNGEERSILLPRNVEDIEHVASTALWVLTNGKTVTDEMKLLRTHEKERDGKKATSTRSSSLASEMQENSTRQNLQKEQPKKSSYMHELHVEISMDTDVQVPDSPKMADLFEAVTSPGIINDGVRAKMANLAQQIIDALPEKIKNDAGLMDMQLSEEHQQVLSYDSGNHLLSNTYQGVSDLDQGQWSDWFQHGYSYSQQNDYGNKQGTSSEDLSQMGGRDHTTYGQASQLGNVEVHTEEEPFPSRSISFEPNYFDFDQDLGEFFNINVDGNIDTIQKWLGELKLSDGEQREVYEAAKVIQRAFREYRARNTCRQADIERKAAVTIQCCYRRYKQFCYFKKLLKAAIVVQKHFRLKKVNQKREGSGNGDELPEHPTLDAQSIRIQVPPNSSSLLREHRAAATIQHAYRGHRKRQAAARTIQKFWKQNIMKFRKMHEPNGVECSLMQVNGVPSTCQIEDLRSHHSLPPQQHIQETQTPLNTSLTNHIMSPNSVQPPPISTMTTSMHMNPTRPLLPMHITQTTIIGNNN